MATKAPSKPALKLDRVSKKGRGGARPGAGRSSKAAILGAMEFFDKHCPEEKRGQIVESLTEQAIKGSIEAAKILFDRIYGRPTEHKEHSGLDGAAIKHDVFLHRYDKQIDPE